MFHRHFKLYVYFEWSPRVALKNDARATPGEIAHGHKQRLIILKTLYERFGTIVLWTLEFGSHIREFGKVHAKIKHFSYLDAFAVIFKYSRSFFCFSSVFVCYDGLPLLEVIWGASKCLLT